MKLKSGVKFSAPILLLALLAAAYNNFSRLTSENSKSQALNANTSLSEKISSSKALLRDQVQNAFCETSSNYSCLEKVFSSNGDLQPKSSLSCVRLLQGGEICPEGSTLSYDSRAAKAACGSPCEENYDYREYECHLKLRRPGDELYSILITEKSLENAIEKLHQSCLQIKEDAPQ